LREAMLGFWAYATFNLTCLALVRNCSVAIAVVDIVWDTNLTGTTVAIVIWIVRSVFIIAQENSRQNQAKNTAEQDRQIKLIDKSTEPN